MSENKNSVVYFMYVTIAAIVFMVLIYMTCQRIDERIENCIKQGKDPHSCRCAFTVENRC